MRSARIVSACATILLWLSALPASAATITFSDNFDDGDATGWWLGHASQVFGLDNWRVENGVLAQDAPGDAFMALVQGATLSSLEVTVDVFANQVAGYGGVTLWYQGPSSWTAVFLYPGPGVCVFEEGPDVFSCQAYPLAQAVTHELTVSADALTGQIAIQVDGVLARQYQSVNANRAGSSGLYNGNSGGHFDDYLLTGEAVPEPATALLFVTGLATGFAARRLRRPARTR